MDRQEAEQKIGRFLKIVTSNNFHFTGKVINSSDDTLTIIDKFGENVSIRLRDIMIASEVNNDRHIPD